MHVALDLTPLRPRPTGVDVYMQRLVEHLGRVDRESRYTIFVNREDEPTLRGTLPENFRLAPLSLRPRPVRLVFQQLLLPAAARLLAVDVLHSPAFLMPLHRGRRRHVVTVHDMTFFSLRRYHSRLHRSAAFRRAVSASIRRADLLIVPSRSTCQDLVAAMPDIARARIRVIPHGIGPEFRRQAGAEIGTPGGRLGLPAPYVLYLGTVEPRKNLGHLIESYRRLVVADGIAEHLVLAGQLGWDRERLLARLAAPELRGRVHLTGYLAPGDLVRAYAGARLFVYPSLAEGFGFPPLEAMACGVPTIASRTSALAENLADAALLVDQIDDQALVAAMRRALRDEDLRRTLVERGVERAAAFDWERTARSHLACYRELADGTG